MEPKSDPKAPRGRPGDAPGIPEGPQGRLKGLPRGTQGTPEERPGSFWVPKSMQKLESIDFKIDEKPMVLIAYLRLWVAKTPQRKRSKTKTNTGDIIESPGSYFGSPWGHLGGRLVVLGAPLGVLGQLLGTTGGTWGMGGSIGKFRCARNCTGPGHIYSYIYDLSYYFILLLID